MTLLGSVTAVFWPRVRLRDTAVTARADPPFSEDTPSSEIPLLLISYYVPLIYTLITYRGWVQVLRACLVDGETEAPVIRNPKEVHAGWDMRLCQVGPERQLEGSCKESR